MNIELYNVGTYPFTSNLDKPFYSHICMYICHRGVQLPLMRLVYKANSDSWCYNDIGLKEWKAKPNANKP